MFRINKSDKIGYPHLRLPLAIDTLVKPIDDQNANYTSRRSEKKVHFSETLVDNGTQTADNYKLSGKLPSIREYSGGSFSKSNAQNTFNNDHKSDWVPRIWDYNYLLFHLDRRVHKSNGVSIMSCHASHVDGLIG